MMSGLARLTRLPRAEASAIVGSRVALFPRLLGPSFEKLHATVRELHRGSSGSWQGTASVTRGRGWLVALACRIARLPPSMQDAPLRFELRTDADQEVWTRWFGDSPPMASRLRADQWHLVEHLGPARVRFALHEAGGALHWEADSLQVLGVPLPRFAFELLARISALEGHYHFAIVARVAGLGMLIRYEGVLRV